MTEAEFGALVQAFGLWIIAPIALVEGPAISVVSGYLARLGFLGLPQTYACLVVADLVGDSLLYLAGRRWRGRLATPWLGKLGLTRRRLAGGLRAFQAKGARLLVVGKLTHSAGFAVLVAAGMSRMAFGRFLALNLAATLPKVAGLMALGWAFGEISGRVTDWLSGLSILLVVALLAVLLSLVLRKGKPQ